MAFFCSPFYNSYFFLRIYSIYKYEYVFLGWCCIMLSGNAETILFNKQLVDWCDNTNDSYQFQCHSNCVVKQIYYIKLNYTFTYLCCIVCDCAVCYLRKTININSMVIVKTFLFFLYVLILEKKVIQSLQYIQFNGFVMFLQQEFLEPIKCLTKNNYLNLASLGHLIEKCY